MQVGSLSEFFDSAKETARELDRGERLTPKNRVWVAPEDFACFIKPARMQLIRYLRGKERVNFSDLIEDLHRSAASLRRDLKLLSKYQLIAIEKEPQSGNGVHTVITPKIESGKLEIMITI